MYDLRTPNSTLGVDDPFPGVLQAALQYAHADPPPVREAFEGIRQRIALKGEHRSPVVPASSGHRLMGQQLDRLSNPSPDTSASRRLVRWGSYALAVLVVALLSAPAVREIRRRLVPAAQPTPIKEYRTTAGERARIPLPDGSSVVLAPQSRIRFATDFGASSNRAVTLEGQGLFTVVHVAGAPFTVQTGNVATRVLGTSFAVRRYATDSAVQVIVAQGRVAVEGVVLGTGDLATATASDHVNVTRGTDVSNQLAWSEGQLVFERVPLRDVIPELERWYGLTVTVADPQLLDRRIMTTIGPQSATRAVELVALSALGRAEIRGRRVTIYSR